MDLGIDLLGLERLDHDECWAFLADHNVGRVAAVQFGRPIIYPVNYALDEHSVVFRTAPGAKLTAAALGKPVAFEVDETDARFESGTSVIVHGSLREVTDQEERARIEALDLRPWAAGDRDHIVRVEPSWVSGRRIESHTEQPADGKPGND